MLIINPLKTRRLGICKDIGFIPILMCTKGNIMGFHAH